MVSFDKGARLLRNHRGKTPAPSSSGSGNFWKGLSRFAGALVVAFGGGAIFAYFQLPLAWMLGAMTSCTFAAILRLPIGAPVFIRPPMTAIIGVLLGTSFTPTILDNISQWPVSLFAMLVYVALCGGVTLIYFMYVAKLDLPTAYFAAMPGGLVEMITAGDERGGDSRTIALIHSARILLVVLSLPVIVRWMAEVPPGSGVRVAVPFNDFAITSIWIFVTAVLGVLLGHFARLPAKYLLGPMLVSAAIHMTELSDFSIPTIIVSTAQLLLGTAIGCRFVGTPPAEIYRIIGLSIGSTILLLALTFCFAFGLGYITLLSPSQLMLAFSPGGLPEMSLMAFALQIEVGFVAVHHLSRVVLVLLIANAIFPIVERIKKKT